MQLPNHLKVGEIAITPAEIAHIKNSCCWYSLCRQSNIIDIAISDVQYKPENGRLEQMAKYNAVKDRNRDTQERVERFTCQVSATTACSYGIDHVV